MTDTEMAVLIAEAREHAATLDPSNLFTPGCGVVLTQPGSMAAGEIVVAAQDNPRCAWVAWFPASGPVVLDA